MNKKKTKESISEEYYPISMEILQSFPKYRPKVDLYIFKEDIARLYPIAKKDVRLSNEQLEEIYQACKDEILFVSRSDQHIYVDLLSKQAELVLFNSNLLESEIVQILMQALEMRLGLLLEQPLPAYYEPLYKDVMVFCEYIWKDTKRINAFVPKIETKEFKVAAHGVTALIIGCWLYLKTRNDDTNRKNFERLALGLILHNIGLCKVPAHIVYKDAPLNKEETEKYQAHVRQGAALLNKFGLSHASIIQTVVEHHERSDGSGYPAHLTGSKISDNGCISIVANAFADLIVSKNGVPRVTTLEATRQLVKDASLPVALTGVLLKAYADRYFPDV